MDCWGCWTTFLGITYRQVGNSDTALLKRGLEAAREFVEQMGRMGITKQRKNIFAYGVEGCMVAISDRYQRFDPVVSPGKGRDDSE